MMIRFFLASVLLSFSTLYARSPRPEKIIYAPDYIDTYAYFQEDRELLTETVKVSFPFREAGASKSDYQRLWYREFAKKVASPPKLDAALIYKQITTKFPVNNVLLKTDIYLDEQKRLWNLFEWSGTSLPSVQANCLALPQAYVCFHKTMLGDAPLQTLDTVALSDSYIHQPYWRVEALEEFQKRFPEFPLLSDIEWKSIDGGKRNLHFKSLDRSFDVELEATDMVRIIGASLLDASSGERKWIGFGYNIYKVTKEGTDVCKMEIDTGAPSMKKYFRNVSQTKLAKRQRTYFKVLRKKVSMWTRCRGAKFNEETDLLQLE